MNHLIAVGMRKHTNYSICLKFPYILWKSYVETYPMHAAKSIAFEWSK